jgi:hypothetical protein
MAFNVLGFALGSALTRDLADRERATQISLMGGLLGGNLTSVALLAAIASQGSTAGNGTRPLPAPGPAKPTRVQVPDLPDDASRAQLTVTTHTLAATAVPVISDEPKDVVIGSDPPAGAVVSQDTPVTVHVSAGVPVPDVTGKTRKEAEAIVSAAGFVDFDVRHSDKEGPPDVVEHQDPPAGTLEDVGTSEVTVFVFGRKGKRRLAATGGDGDKRQAAD